MFTQLDSKPNPEGFTQASIETPHRSPDLVVFKYFIGLNLICPNLAWFENLALDDEIWTWLFQGLILNMHDVTDICMKLKVPSKIA